MCHACTIVKLIMHTQLQSIFHHILLILYSLNVTSFQHAFLGDHSSSVQLTLRRCTNHVATVRYWGLADALHGMLLLRTLSSQLFVSRNCINKVSAPHLTLHASAAMLCSSYLAAACKYIYSYMQLAACMCITCVSIIATYTVLYLANLNLV